MKYKFENIFLDEKELMSLNSEMIDPILIENNQTQLKEVYEFYKNEHPILYLNGFLGTGKVQLINYSLNFLSQDAVVLKHNCFETTILDDIFLTFFEEFKKLEAQKIIVRPNIKSENFNQKIHSYFSTIEKPILIVLDSFEALTEENRKEIIDFILHLTTFQKVKTILIGRTFKASQFPERLTIDRVSTSPLDKTLFEKYLKNNKVNKANKKSRFADANGVVQEEEENEVLQQEKEDETRAVMKCKVMKYNPDKTLVEAIGGVEITIPAQNVVMTADKMTFNQVTNIIELFDNVKVVKAGNEVFGDYMKINLNEESGVLDNLRASQYVFDIQAEHGYMFGDDILTTNGKISSRYDKIISMYTSGFGTGCCGFG
jgi:hypothetical protein